MAYQMTVKKVRDDKIKNYLQRLMQKNPGMNEMEAKRRAEATQFQVRPEEVPTRFPLIPVLVLLYVAGGVFALGRMPRTSMDSTCFTIPTGVYIGTVLLAGVLLATLHMTGGIIYTR